MSNSQYQRFKACSLEIHEWSKANFGANQSADNDLFGIGEEIGELWVAHEREDRYDAIADIAIYFGDYCASVGLYPAFIVTDTACSIMAAYGKLCRCRVKRNQGIRGYDNDEFYAQELQQAISNFWYALDNKARVSTGSPVITLMENVWQRVVSKRNWNQNKETGA